MTDMDPLSAGLISGGASLLSGFMSSSTSAANTQANIEAQQQAQLQTEQFNAGQAQIQRDYETQMSNTAYQRATADMQRAGLNPMMMFGSGGASSTPSVSAPSVGTPNMALSQKTSALGNLGGAVSTALNSAIQARTVDKMADEIANLKATRALTTAETVTEGERPQLVKAQTDATQQTAGKVAQDIRLRTPAEMEAQGVTNLGAGTVGSVGKVKYLAGSAGDVLQPIINSATGVGRIGQAFQDIANSSLKRKIEQGNFVGKYGRPVDEYLSE